MNIPILIIIASAFSMLMLIVFVGTRKTKEQVHYMYMFLALCCMLWCIGAIGEASADDMYEFNAVFVTFLYFVVALTSLAFLLLGLVIFNKKIKFKWWHMVVVFPVLFSTISVATNDMHHLFIVKYCLDMNYAEMGILFYIHCILSYSYILASIVLLVQSAIKSSGLFSKHVFTLLLGISVPLVVNVLTTFGLVNGYSYYTAPAFSATTILIGVGIMKYGMFKIVPIPLQKITENIPDAFFVVNEFGRIIEFNNKLSVLFENECEVKLNDSLSDFIDSLKIDGFDSAKVSNYIRMSNQKRNTMSFEIEYKTLFARTYLSVEITPIYNKHQYIGSTIFLKDITKMKEYIQTIRDYQAILENNLQSVTQDKHELLIRNAVIERMSNVDSLTDLYNHRIFQKYLGQLILQSNERNTLLQIAILDIDDFKKINDTFGHSVGDNVLKRVADKIRNLVTPEDIVARYGGEEFAIIFNNHLLEDTVEILENIRKAIASEQHPELDRMVTVSIGLHEYKKGNTKKETFEIADEALYDAKHSGKNKIVVKQDKSETVTLVNPLPFKIRCM